MAGQEVLRQKIDQHLPNVQQDTSRLKEPHLILHPKTKKIYIHRYALKIKHHNWHFAQVLLQNQINWCEYRQGPSRKSGSPCSTKFPWNTWNIFFQFFQIFQNLHFCPNLWTSHKQVFVQTCELRTNKFGLYNRLNIEYRVPWIVYVLFRT